VQQFYVLHDNKLLKFLSPFQLTTAVVGVKTRADVAAGVHIFLLNLGAAKNS
jgi:hypothetical protein